MGGQNFIPRTDGEKDLWLKNFANKLPNYVSKYNIAAADLADMQQGSVAFSYWLNYHNQLEDYGKKITRYKNELRDGVGDSTPSVLPVFPALGTAPVVTPGLFVRAGSLAQRIKKHYNYTEADGKNLGIDTIPQPTVDLQNLKPVISVHLIQGGLPEIVWKRNGANALEIYADRGEGYQFLAIDSFPNYTDKFPIPEQLAIWKYKCIYIYHDERVGEWSDEVQITVTPSIDQGNQGNKSR